MIAASLGKNADHIGATLDLPIQPFQGIGVVDLATPRAGFPVTLAEAVALMRSAVRSPCPAPQSASVSSAISRCAAKPIISRSKLASEDFSRRS